MSAVRVGSRGKGDPERTEGTRYDDRPPRDSAGRAARWALGLVRGTARELSCEPIVEHAPAISLFRDTMTRMQHYVSREVATVVDLLVDVHVGAFRVA